MQSVIPDFKPSLLLGILAKPIARGPILQNAINRLTKLFIQKHPKVITKMAEYTPARLVLIPSDMPFCFFVEFTKDNMQINIIDQNAFDGKNLTCITASLELFIKMLEGNLDGDALFFSRQLTVAGDTTIIVALRNILEAENVNIKTDIDETFGVFSGAFHLVNNLLCAIYKGIDTNFDIVKSSIVDKLDQKVTHNASKHNKLEDKFKKLDKQVSILSEKTKSLKEQLRSQNKDE